MNYGLCENACAHSSSDSDDTVDSDEVDALAPATLGEQPKLLFFCGLHCTEHFHDCVKNDGGLTKNFINCNMQYGLCMNGCEHDSDDVVDSDETELKSSLVAPASPVTT